MSGHLFPRGIGPAPGPFSRPVCRAESGAQSGSNFVICYLPPIGLKQGRNSSRERRGSSRRSAGRPIRTLRRPPCDRASAVPPVRFRGLPGRARPGGPGRRPSRSGRSSRRTAPVYARHLGHDLTNRRRRIGVERGGGRVMAGRSRPVAGPPPATLHPPRTRSGDAVPSRPGRTGRRDRTPCRVADGPAADVSWVGRLYRQGRRSEQ